LGQHDGIIGRIRLAATPPCGLRRLQVYPDVEKKLGAGAVEIGNATSQAVMAS